ncbi:DUF2972 domain-containing protein [Campylobacter coli]|nr:DUF2972 domain-containing protein [Campylobacter coli]
MVLLKYHPNLYQPKSLNYNFILFSYNLSGHLAFKTFLNYCNITEKIFFKDGFSILPNNKNYYLNICLYNNENILYKKLKLINFLNNQNILLLTRDPISRIKTFINHGESTVKTNYSIKENTDKALDRVRYQQEKKYPDINTVSLAMKTIFFSYYTDIKPFLEIQNHQEKQKKKYQYNIFYIDTKDILPEKAFDTFKNLALEFNFNPPNKEEKDKFQQKIWNEFVHFLPFNLILCKKDYPFLKKDIEISIVQNHLKTGQDYKKYFIEKNNNLYEKIAICINDKDLKLLVNNKQILQELKQYFFNFTKSLKKQIDFHKEVFVDENQILEFLSKNKNLTLNLKKTLDYELQHIKQHRPDIVASWKYYQEFEKMCEKLDKKE